jgi:hypothetical protein
VTSDRLLNRCAGALLHLRAGATVDGKVQPTFASTDEPIHVSIAGEMVAAMDFSMVEPSLCAYEPCRRILLRVLSRRTLAYAPTIRLGHRIPRWEIFRRGTAIVVVWRSENPSAASHLPDFGNRTSSIDG